MYNRFNEQFSFGQQLKIRKVLVRVLIEITQAADTERNAILLGKLRLHTLIRN